MRVPLLFFALALTACTAPDESGDTYTTLGCTPGEQRACACPGGLPDGIQACAADGDHYGPCMGCTPSAPTTTDDPDTITTTTDAPGSTATTDLSSTTDPPSTTTADDDPCSGTAHCANGVTDCGEPHTDCGADCPATAAYTWCDCLVDTPRNGDEVCDDTGFTVDDPAPVVLVCLEPTGGQSYIATNTSIDPDDQVMRCSGWELMGQNPWDHLQYVLGPLTCDAAQKTTAPLDLAPYTGQTLWLGAHDHPMGGGSGTTACMAHPK